MIKVINLFPLPTLHDDLILLDSGNERDFYLLYRRQWLQAGSVIDPYTFKESYHQ